MTKRTIIATFFLAVLLLIYTFLYHSPTAPLYKLSEIDNQLFQQPLERQLTLENIFSDNEEIRSNTITLIATGDVMLGRSVNQNILKTKNFNLPFEATSQFLQNADLTFINLEGPFVNPCPTTSEGMTFCADTRSVQGLKFAGIDIANLANNHIYNYKEDGIRQTVDILTQNGIAYTGINGSYYTTVKGTRFAFLGYNDIERNKFNISWAEPERIAKEISRAKQNSDIVVVQFHFGNEYQTMPSARQKELAHLAIDLGADLIIGNHPHWTQPIEIYKGKLITYAHGNFVFDQNWSKETQEGIVGKYYFENKKLVDAKFYPVEIAINGQARLAKDSDRDRTINKLKQLSLQLSRQ